VVEHIGRGFETPCADHGEFMSTEAELMKFLKMVQKMLIHHQHTIETLKESLGDSAIIALSAAQSCDHTDCNYPATVKHDNCSLHLCDRHLAERVASGETSEVEWEDLHYADCARNLHDYIELKAQHDANFTVH
jgi:hypothetical protein